MGDVSLTEVTFSNELTHIGEWAFSKCRNLKTVIFEGKYASDIMGKGVFEGCEKLEKICFKGFAEDESHLLAAAVSRLKVPHLLRSDDVGEQSWFSKWDLALRLFLESDDEKMSAANALCGEEDISYDGIGSIDGELPGESGDFVKEAAINKCLLCYQRLTFDKYLSEESGRFIRNYLISHSFQTEEAYSWITLKEKCGDDIAYYKLYLEVVNPDNETKNRMIEDLAENHVAAKSYLIKECSKSGSSVLDGLFI